MEKHGLPAVYNALMSGFGEEIGSGDIRFIQDVGQKLEGTPYLDKNTNKLYLCVSTTNSTNNDSSFMRFDMKEAFTKLQNLSEVGNGYIRYSEGTQMCFGNLIFGDTSMIQTVTFPKPFVRIDYMDANHVRANTGTFSDITPYNGEYSSTQATFLRKVQGVVTGATCTYLVIGRWKM